MKLVVVHVGLDVDAVGGDGGGVMVDNAGGVGNGVAFKIANMSTLTH